MILALNELMKFFLPKSTASVCSTEPAWLAYVKAGTAPSTHIVPKSGEKLISHSDKIDVC